MAVWDVEVDGLFKRPAPSPRRARDQRFDASQRGYLRGIV